MKLQSNILNACRVLMAFCIAFSAFNFAQAQTAYETETWEPALTLMWANPGTDGELNDATNWRLADGGAAQAAPDRNTDVVLPAADQPYRVTGGRTDQVRHITVEKNAILTGSHRNEVEIWGNCHVKQGGFSKYISIRGDKNTFFKVDEAAYPNPENGKLYHHPSRRVNFDQLCSGHLAHKFQVCKFGTASVEFFGPLGVSDEIMVQHGKMIVSGEFRYSGITGKGALEIYDGGIVEIQSGGAIAPFMPSNTKSVYNVNVYRNGVLQAGSPERPLTSNAYLRLGFAENDQPGRTGLYTALGSMVRVYTTDPKKAKLVITSTSSDPDFHDALGVRTGDPNEKASGKTGIAMQLAGDIQLDGVQFDYVSLGGISLVGAAQPADWKNVSFGSHCAGEPSDLFSELSVDPNVYYHNRAGDQKSEIALTQRAVALMEEYMELEDPFRMNATPMNTKIVKVGKGQEIIDTPIAVLFKKPIDVAIQTRVPGAKIRYTLDGTPPTKESPVYEGAIHLAATTKITAIAYKPGVGFSPVFSTSYVFE